MLPPPLRQTDQVTTTRAPDLLRDLALVVGADRVHAGDLERTLYSRDASLLRGDVPTVVCFPQSTAEVQGVVRVCAHHDVPFVTRGSGTGLAGGAVPVGPAVVIATTKM